MAWTALAIGFIAAISLVPLMTMRRDPLVPPSLFRSRNFSVTNVSTLLIYGALYVFSYYLALFLQGTLGYTALGSGLAGLPPGWPWRCCQPASATWPGGWVRAASWPSGRR